MRATSSFKKASLRSESDILRFSQWGGQRLRGILFGAMIAGGGIGVGAPLGWDKYVAPKLHVRPVLALPQSENKIPSKFLLAFCSVCTILGGAGIAREMMLLEKGFPSHEPR